MTNIQILDEIFGQDFVDSMSANELSVLLNSIGVDNRELYAASTEVETELDFSV